MDSEGRERSIVEPHTHTDIILYGMKDTRAVEQYQVTVVAGPLHLQNLIVAVEQYQAVDVHAIAIIQYSIKQTSLSSLLKGR